MACKSWTIIAFNIGFKFEHDSWSLSFSGRSLYYWGLKYELLFLRVSHYIFNHGVQRWENISRYESLPHRPRYRGSLTVKILWITQHISILQNVSIGNIFTASWYANTWLNHPKLKTKLTAEFSSLWVRAVWGLHLEETCHTQDSNKNWQNEWVYYLKL